MAKGRPKEVGFYPCTVKWGVNCIYNERKEHACKKTINEHGLYCECLCGERH